MARKAESGAHIHFCQANEKIIGAIFKTRKPADNRVPISANHHPPPHVHAIRRDGVWARLALNCPEGPVTLIALIDQSGFRRAEITPIGQVIAADLAKICEEWRRIHG